jgi:hypothetical protein
MSIDPSNTAPSGSEPRKLKKRYTLDELLAQCDPSLPFSEEELEWMNMPTLESEWASF